MVYFFLLSIIYHNKIKFIYTVHNSAETEVGSRAERLIRRFFFKNRYFLPVAISDETKKSFMTFYKLDKVDVIYNGRKFVGKSIDYGKVVNEIAELKPSDKSLIFCHVSRYDEKQKNQKMLISAFNKLRDEGFDVVLLVIGWGFENAIDLKEMANDSIHFLGSKSNVNDYLYASDAFCLSSVFEGMPISLIEALACGCVPICTPVGGIVNAIEHKVTGFISNTVSETDYLEALKQFIKYGTSIDRNKLVKYYHENFSIEQCASKYLELVSKN